MLPQPQQLSPLQLWKNKIWDHAGSNSIIIIVLNKDKGIISGNGSDVIYTDLVCTPYQMQLTLLKDGSTHQSQINDQIRFTNAITDLSDDSYKSHVIIDSYKTAKTFKLIDSIKTLYEMDNAGGASAQYSEYLSGVVYSGFGAHSFIEEMAVPYWFNYKKVDYLCSIYGQRIGISVKRAVNREIMLQLKELKRKDARNLTDATFTRKEADRFLDSAIRGLIVL